MAGDVTILTGPPAAGKTTVAEIVATETSTPTAHLVTDMFYRAIRNGYVPPYLPEAQRQNEVVTYAWPAVSTRAPGAPSCSMASTASGVGARRDRRIRPSSQIANSDNAKFTVIISTAMTISAGM
jgi:hypothetical protein